jgi:hypothetical protein
MTEYEKGRLAWAWLEFSELKSFNEEFQRGWLDTEDDYHIQMNDDFERSNYFNTEE